MYICINATWHYKELQTEETSSAKYVSIDKDVSLYLSSPSVTPYENEYNILKTLWAFLYGDMNYITN
jgi:hypothetical protein